MEYNVTENYRRKLFKGDEHFTFYGIPLDKTFSDFAMWFISDILDSGNRGPMMEYVIGNALGIDFTEARTDNQAWDLMYRNCYIEVKTSAYVQAWNQTQPANISFSIRKTNEKSTWDLIDKSDDNKRKRHSALYIFCLYKYRDKPTANPMVLDHWDFYIVPTKLLDEKLGDQKTINLKKLNSLNPIKCEYDGIRESVDLIIDDYKKVNRG